VKILFMLDKWVNRGSIQAVANYVRAGAELGHVVTVHGRSDPSFPGVRFSTDIDAFDYAVLIFESGLDWLSALRLPSLLAGMPRERRLIIDADGMYNATICVDGYDRNHADEAGRRRWFANYDALSNRIAQPTVQSPHTRSFEPGVQALPFYGYDPGPARAARRHRAPKRWDVLHVGHNWWRWRDVSQVLLPALERARHQIGDVCFLGSWWDAPPAGARELGLEAAFQVDPDRLERLNIEIHPAVPYTEVIAAMSRSRLNIMTQRPLFRSLRLLTSKFFEIFSADTIPLLVLDPDHAESIYGPRGRELTLDVPDEVADKILDALARPSYYAEVVEEIRRHLAERHSYHCRLQELTALLSAHTAPPRSGGVAGGSVGATAREPSAVAEHLR
jgi:hypothetical protein